MRGKRLWHTLRLFSIPSSIKRADYLRKSSVFGAIGKGVVIEDRRVPLYPELIKIGNNVVVASHVLFVTHDVTYAVINGIPCEPRNRVQEKIGCIEIGNNVFIGSNSTILYDVSIGDNVVIGAGSLVNKDIPSNSVAVGSPARVIGTFDDFVAARKEERDYPDELRPAMQTVSQELVDHMWKNFYAKRDVD